MLFLRNSIPLFVCTLLLIGLVGCTSRSEGYSVYSGKTTIRNSKSMHKATMRPYVVNGKKYYPTRVSVGDQFSGMASWYGKDFHGKQTSNGEIYNMYALTAAHKTLPMNTMVKVKNLLNNKTLVVRINDRGPFVKGRIIDLSSKAASMLGAKNRGTVPVRIEVIGFGGLVNKSGTILQTKKQQSVQSVSFGNFLVQIGAFRKVAGAKTYSKRLYKKYPYYRTLVKRSPWHGQVIYRVYLKGFKSEEEARDFIAQENLKGSFIVRE